MAYSKFVSILMFENQFFVLFISEMCPKPTETRNVSRQSHVEDLEGIPGLFKALTEEDDEDADKWTTMTYPVDHEIVSVKGDKTYKFVLRKSRTVMNLAVLKMY